MFQGFSPETIDFLWGLRMNNNRPWFMEHKQEYIDTLYEPMKALAAEISAPFAEIPNFICKTSRIYRDMRIPHDTPYKESLWICMRRDAKWWMQEPSLFFELTPDNYSYGFLFWQPTVPMMNAMRQNMLEQPTTFLEMVKAAEKKSKIKISGQSYVRKKPCDIPELDPYYQLKNIYAIKEQPINEKLFSADLAKTVRKSLQGLYPLCQYCQQFTDVQ